MPKAEVGSSKHLANRMKAKGLQRLRWYCQVCERQMRDENGFKCHVQSESHVRQMLIVGENSQKFIQDYSNQFHRDFLNMLRTAHGEKKVNLNHAYQEYIGNKEHVHMNATRWPSLTEYGKFLGREGLCRVEEGERGLEVAWVDNSPEALRRQDAIRKKDRQDRGDEEREQRLIREQVRRAQRDAEDKTAGLEGSSRALEREEGEKIKLSFGAKSAPASAPVSSVATVSGSFTAAGIPSPPASSSDDEKPDKSSGGDSDEVVVAVGSFDGASQSIPTIPSATAKVSISLGASAKPKNVFAAAGKNKLGAGPRPTSKSGPTRPMSEAERIMKEEIERKRAREAIGSQAPSFKRRKV